MAGPGTRIGFLLQDPQRLLPGFSDVGAFVGIGFRGILDYGYNDVYYSNYSLAIMRGAAEWTATSSGFSFSWGVEASRAVRS